VAETCCRKKLGSRHDEAQELEDVTGEFDMERSDAENAVGNTWNISCISIEDAIVFSRRAVALTTHCGAGCPQAKDALAAAAAT
jgi:hypothetical protein